MTPTSINYKGIPYSCSLIAGQTADTARIRIVPRRKKAISADSQYAQMSATNGLHIGMALDYLRGLSPADFEHITGRFNGGNDDVRKSMIYYLILFRGERHIQELLQNTELPLSFVAALLRTVSARNKDESGYRNKVLDEMLDLFPEETLYTLLVSDEGGKLGNRLVLPILLRMDLKRLDRYFEDPARVRSFIEGVSLVPARIMKSFFFRNPKLHGYYVFLYHSVDVSRIPNAEAIYSIDLSEVEEVKKIATDLAHRFDLDAERALPLSKRNNERVEYIVSRIRRFDDIPGVLESLIHEGVVFEDEKSLVEQILDNPMFRDVLEKYSEGLKQSDQVEFDFVI